MTSAGFTSLIPHLVAPSRLPRANTLDAVIANYKPANVARWHRVEQTWRGPAARLQAAAAKDPAEARDVRALRSQIEQYISDYGELILRIAQISPETARSQVAHAEGATRLQEIVFSTEAIANRAATNAVEKADDANRLARQATIGGLIAVILTPILLILLGLWIARLVAEPLRRTVDAASSVAACVCAQ